MAGKDNDEVLLVGAAAGLPNENDGWVLLSLGAEGAEKSEGLEVSFDPVELGTLRLMEGAEGAGDSLFPGLANNDDGAEPVTNPGADRDDVKGGAPKPIDLASEGDNFFCSWSLALIFAIASASRSCFSHFENVLKLVLRDEGLSTATPGGTGL